MSRVVENRYRIRPMAWEGMVREWNVERLSSGGVWRSVTTFRVVDIHSDEELIQLAKKAIEEDRRFPLEFTRFEPEKP